MVIGDGAEVPPSLDILLAEDNPFIQRVTVAFLEMANHSVRVAETGREALAMAQTSLFDVVLMDIQMPEMDGIEATRRIRALGGKWGSVPIIGFTPVSDPQILDSARGAGMCDIIGKSFAGGNLTKALATALGTKSS